MYEFKMHEFTSSEPPSTVIANMSVYLSACLPVCPSACLPAYLSVVCLCVYTNIQISKDKCVKQKEVWCKRFHLIH